MYKEEFCVKYLRYLIYTDYDVYLIKNGPIFVNMVPFQDVINLKYSNFFLLSNKLHLEFTLESMGNIFFYCIKG